MYADISRYAFEGDPQDTRVIFQQGHPITDADLNFQAAIQYDLHRDFVKQLIPWHGTLDKFDFSFDKANKQLSLLRGNYYINGMRCSLHSSQSLPNVIVPDAGQISLYYLMAWEDTATHFQDSTLIDSSLRENQVPVVTAWRGRIRWQIMKKDLADGELPNEIKQRKLNTKSNFMALLLKGKARLPTLTIEVAEETSKGAAQIIRVQVHRNSDQGLYIKWCWGSGSEIFQLTRLDNEHWISENFGTGWAEVRDQHGMESESLYWFDSGKARVREKSPTDKVVEFDFEPEMRGDHAFYKVLSKSKDRKFSLHRWNHAKGPSDRISDGYKVDGKVMLFNGKVSLSFDGTGYQPGDYWILRYDGSELSVNGRVFRKDNDTKFVSDLKWAAAPLLLINSHRDCAKYVRRFKIGRVTKKAVSVPPAKPTEVCATPAALDLSPVSPSITSFAERDVSPRPETANSSPLTFAEAISHVTSNVEAITPAASTVSWLRPLWSAVSSKPRRTALAGGYVALGLFLAQNAVSMWSKGDEQARSAQKTQEMTDRELAEISRRLLPGKDKTDGSLAKVDQWLIDELSLAMESDPVQGAVRQRLDAAIERMLANPAFQERVLQLARPLAGNAAVNPPASASADAASNSVGPAADQTSVPSDLNKGEGAPSSPSLPPANNPIPANPAPATPSPVTASPEIPKVDGTPSATSPDNSTPPVEQDQNSSSTTTEAPNNRN